MTPWYTSFYTLVDVCKFEQLETNVRSKHIAKRNCNFKEKQQRNNWVNSEPRIPLSVNGETEITMSVNIGLGQRGVELARWRSW